MQDVTQDYKDFLLTVALLPRIAKVELFGIDDDYIIRVTDYPDVRRSNNKNRKSHVNDEKLECNVNRAKRKIYEYACCNRWDYYITLTFDGSKIDRTDLQKIHKSLSVWIKNYNRLHGVSMRYLFVPELHHDGVSYHLHGLIAGLPAEHLHQFVIGDSMGKYIADKVRQGYPVFDWPDYRRKFGFCDLEPIHSLQGVSRYITKYCTKELAMAVTGRGEHLYWVSRGLAGARLIASEIASPALYQLILDDSKIVYDSLFCRISEFEGTEDNLQLIRDCINAGNTLE